MPTSPLGRVIVIVGLPGSGKSTLGKSLSAAIRGVFVDRDTVMGPIVDAVLAAGGGLAGDYSSAPVLYLRDPAYAAAENVAVENAEMGFDAVLISPCNDRESTDWYPNLTKRLGQTPLIIWVDATVELTCTRRALRGNARDTVALRNWPDFAAKRVVGAPACPHLRLDAGGKREELLAASVRYVTNVGHPAINAWEGIMQIFIVTKPEADRHDADYIVGHTTLTAAIADRDTKRGSTINTVNMVG